MPDESSGSLRWAIRLLIYIAVAVLVIWVAWWLISLVLPYPFSLIVVLIIGLVLLYGFLKHSGTI